MEVTLFVISTVKFCPSFFAYAFSCWMEKFEERLSFSKSFSISRLRAIVNFDSVYPFCTFKKEIFPIYKWR